MTLTYCIESSWEYRYPRREPHREPSVEPMLGMVESAYGAPYRRRNAATVREMLYWMGTELPEIRGRAQNNKNVDDCSIIYFATHGGPGVVYLSGDTGECEDGEYIRVTELPDRLGKGFAHGCLVHFSGCHVMDSSPEEPEEHDDEELSDAKLLEFMRRSGASVVSGYKGHAGWTDFCFRNGVLVPGAPPALALELLLFSSIRAMGIYLDHHTSVESRLLPLARKLQKCFPECGFRLRTRWGGCVG